MRRSLRKASRVRGLALVLALLGTGSILHVAGVAHGADAKIEAEAKKADGDAMDLWLAADFKGAKKSLEGALKKCGGSKCESGTLAALHRDLGIVLITMSDKKGGAKEFDAAFAADASVTMGKDYLDNADVKAAWEDAKKKGGGGGTVPTTPTTTTTTAPVSTVNPEAEGDLTIEAKVAPIGYVLPIVVGVPDGLDVDVIKVSYKTAAMEKYKVLEAKKDGKVYVAQVPCEDTQFQGDLKLYVRAYDADKNEIEHYGTLKKPVILKLVDKMAEGDEAPTFPGGKEPDKCTEKGDCQPGFPCDKSANKKPQGSGCDTDDECDAGLRCLEGLNPGEKRCDDDHAGGGGGGSKSGEGKKFWIGVDGQIDLLYIGAAENICKETTWACTKNGVDIGVKDQLNADGSPKGIDVEPPGGGKTSGGPALGTARVFLSADYFLGTNLALGVRLGYAFNGNPTTNAKFLPFHAEARVTYFLGEGPVKKPQGLKPYILAAAGLAEFDAAVPDIVAVPHDPRNADDPTGCAAAPADQKGSACRISGIKAYRLAGQAFAAMGAGIWYMLGPKFAINLGVKLLFPLPTFSLGIAPELGIKLAL